MQLNMRIKRLNSHLMCLLHYNPETELTSRVSPALQADSSFLSHCGNQNEIEERLKST